MKIMMDYQKYWMEIAILQLQNYLLEVKILAEGNPREIVTEMNLSN